MHHTRSLTEFYYRVLFYNWEGNCDSCTILLYHVMTVQDYVTWSCKTNCITCQESNFFFPFVFTMYGNERNTTFALYIRTFCTLHLHIIFPEVCWDILSITKGTCDDTGDIQSNSSTLNKDMLKIRLPWLSECVLSCFWIFPVVYFDSKC